MPAARPGFGVGLILLSLPDEIVNHINDAIVQVLTEPETRRLFEARGFAITNLGPKPFAAKLAREHASRGEEVRRFGVKRDR